MASIISRSAENSFVFFFYLALCGSVNFLWTLRLNFVPCFHIHQDVGLDSKKVHDLFVPGCVLSHPGILEREAKVDIGKE